MPNRNVIFEPMELYLVLKNIKELLNMLNNVVCGDLHRNYTVVDLEVRKVDGYGILDHFPPPLAAQ